MMTKRPSDWEEREDELTAAVRDELNALRERHRDDLPVQILRAADTGALPDVLQETAAAAIEGSEWNHALVADVNDGSAVLSQHAEDRLLARIHRDAQRRPAGRPTWFAQFWRPALAVAAAGVLVTTVVWRLEAPAVINHPAPETVAPVPAAPAFHLGLDKPDVKLTAMALVRRSAGRNATFADDVAPAMNAYRAGDYSTAAAEFARVASIYPESVEIPFYLGISRLFLNDPPGAVDALQTARRVTDGTFRADIGWYLAVAQERAGRPDAAQAELTSLCSGTSSYSKRACDAAASFK